MRGSGFNLQDHREKKDERKEGRKKKEGSKGGIKRLRRLENVEGMVEYTFWKNTLNSCLSKGMEDKKWLKVFSLEPKRLASDYGIPSSVKEWWRRAGLQDVLMSSILNNLNLRG